MAAATGAALQQVLDVAAPAAFEQLLTALMNPDNNVRSAAEAVFQAAKAHPEALVAQLVRCLRTHAAPELRALSAVLLRKTLTKGDTSPWDSLSPATQAGVKAELLKCITEEADVSITKKVGDTVCELAAGILEAGGWPELLPFLFQAVQSGPDSLRESALQIFAQLSLYIGDSMGPYLPTLHQVFQRFMSSGGTLGVRVAALRAAVALISALEEPTQRNAFQDLIPDMLQTLGAALTSDEEAAQEVLALLVALAEEDARVCRKYVNEMALAMLQIAEATTLEVGTRQLAVEFVVTLAEAREQAPGMIRKLDALVGRLLQCCVSFLLDIEEDAAWANAEDEANLDAGQGELFDVGMEALDRLATALGGKAVMPVLASVLPSLMGHADWKYRHASLCTLSQVAEGCAKLMKRDAGGAAAAAVRMLADPHPRVRWAAINALGQLCTDLGPDLQHAAHSTVLPGLIAVMDDAANPRVQAHAAAATVNFSEDCDPAVLAPYMDGMVVKLLTMLQQGKRPVQEAALTALAAVADNAQAQFVRYYDTVMPFLTQIIQAANQPEHLMLRAKALECSTLVGMAVGKERFRDHARTIIDVMARLQGAPPAEADDPTPGYLLQAWARIATCMGDEFLPYLSVVMPPLLAAAQVAPDVREHDEDEEADDDCQLVAVEDKVLAIKTSVLEDKATACDMLCCYVKQLSDGLLPYLEDITRIMIPLLKFYLSEEVRTAAVSIMPDLLMAGRSAVTKGTKDAAWFQSMLAAMWKPMLEALRQEPDESVIAAFLLSLSDAADAAGPMLSSEQMSSLTEELRLQLEKSAERSAAREAQAQRQDFDEEERELLAEENDMEDDVVDQVQECISSLLKTFRAGYLPYLDTLLVHIAPLMGAQSGVRRRIAVCVFDDIMEFASDNGASARYFDALYPAVLAALADKEHADLRQAAAYGVGVCAQHCPERFRSRARDSVAALLALVQAPGARSAESADATDNAISALGKAAELCGDAFDAAPVLGVWLDYLPLRDDKEEAALVHAQLCRLVEAGDARLLGPANERLPRVLAVFADCLAAGDQLMSAATAASMRALLGRMQAAMPPAALAAAWGSLTAAQQTALSSAVAAGAPA